VGSTARAYQAGPDAPIFRARIELSDGTVRIIGPYATVGPARAQANSHGKGRAVVSATVERTVGPWLPLDFAKLADIVGTVAMIEAERAEQGARTSFAEILEAFVALDGPAMATLEETAPDLVKALDALNGMVVLEEFRNGG